MASVDLHTVGLLLAVYAGFLVIRYVAWTATALSGLPHPPAPSFLAGNAVELMVSKIHTRFNVWKREYGHTYKMRGPFRVRQHATNCGRFPIHRDTATDSCPW